MIRKLQGIVFLLVMSVAPFTVLAGNTYLNGSGVTNNATVSFASAPNWSAGVPGIADYAGFTNAATPVNVTFAASITNAGAVFDPTNACTVNLKTNPSATSATWYLTNTLIVGQIAGGNPTAQITAPLRVAVTNATDSGTETVGVSGSGTLGISASATNIANQIVLGQNATGVGTLTVGGRAFATNTTGTAAIIAGQSGSGSISVNNAAGVLQANTLVLGQNAGSTGIVTLTLGSATVANGTGTGVLIIGSNGVGALTLSGGSLTADVWSVATTNAGSAGTVTWNAGSRLTIGGVTNGLTIVTNLLGTSWGYNLAQTLILNTNIPGTMSYPNGFTLGETATGNGSLALGGGTFVATNTAGNATLRVGVNGAGSLTFGGAAKVTLDSLTLATNVGSQAALIWNPGATVTIGGNADAASNIGNLLGTSFGRTSKQALTMSTNVTVAAPPGGLMLGETATGTGVLNIAAGAFAATNASGTGAVNWGGGAGVLAITGGTVVADHLYATNGAKSLVLLQSGTLITRDSTILASNLMSTFDIGAGSGAATWFVQGGNNLIATTNNVRFGTAVASPGYLNVSGSSTLLTINGALVQMGLQYGTTGSGITVSNGAALVMNADLRIGQGGNGDIKGYSTNLVTDPGSRWLINDAFYMGDNNGGGYDSVAVSNGASFVVTNTIQIGTRSAENSITAIGPGSTLSTPTLVVGFGNTHGFNNRVTLTAGATGTVTSALTIGNSNGADSTNCSLTVSGAALFVTNAARNASMVVGSFGGFARMLVTAAGIIQVSGNATEGLNTTGTNATIMITGSGSRWDIGGILTVGSTAPSALFSVADSAVVTASNLTMATAATATNASVTISGGTVLVTNMLQVGLAGQASFTLNAGLVSAAQVTLTNAISTFAFNGGTLATTRANVSNGVAFVVGDGTDAATLNLMGGTAHRFANGLLINTNATLMAGSAGSISSAVVTGNVTLARGSVLSLDFTATSRDAIAVVGTLTLPAQATVTANSLDSSTPWNITNVLSATSLVISGATDLSGWTAPGGYYVKTQGNAVVLTRKPPGTSVMIR